MGMVNRLANRVNRVNRIIRMEVLRQFRNRVGGMAGARGVHKRFVAIWCFYGCCSGE